MNYPTSLSTATNLILTATLILASTRSMWPHRSWCRLTPTATGLAWVWTCSIPKTFSGCPRENKTPNDILTNESGEPYVSDRLQLMRKSLANCLENQAVVMLRSGCQVAPLRTMALRITSSFRMQAVSATLAGLPAWRSRW